MSLCFHFIGKEPKVQGIYTAYLHRTFQRRQKMSLEMFFKICWFVLHRDV